MTQTTHALKPPIVRALRQSKIDGHTVSFHAPGDRALEQTVLDVLRVIGGETAGPNAVRFPSDPKPILKRVIASKAVVRGQALEPAAPAGASAGTPNAEGSSPVAPSTASPVVSAQAAKPEPRKVEQAKLDAPKPAKPAPLRTIAKSIAQESKPMTEQAKPAPVEAPKPAKPKREPSSLKGRSRRELQILDGRGAVVAVMDVSDLSDVDTRKLAARLRLPNREPVGLLLTETITREFKA